MIWAIQGRVCALNKCNCIPVMDNEIHSARPYYDLTRVYLRVRVHRLQFPNNGNKFPHFKTMSCCCIIPVPHIKCRPTKYAYSTGYSAPYMGCVTSRYMICRGFSPKGLNRQQDKCWEIVGRLCRVNSKWWKAFLGIVTPSPKKFCDP